MEERRRVAVVEIMPQRRFGRIFLQEESIREQHNGKIKALVQAFNTHHWDIPDSIDLKTWQQKINQLSMRMQRTHKSPDEVRAILAAVPIYESGDKDRRKELVGVVDQILGESDSRSFLNEVTNVIELKERTRKREAGKNHDKTDLPSGKVIWQALR